MKRLFLFTALVGCLMCLGARAARAEDKDAAREEFRAASQHYDLGEYEAALIGFKEAYRHYEEPIFLFNIAQCHRQLGQNSQAVRAYRMYLIKAPDAANRDEVRSIVDKLDVAIQKESAAREAPPTTSMSPPATGATVETPGKPPVYKKWWLWTVVGAVAVAGVGVALGVTLAPGPGAPNAASNLMTIKY